MIDTHVHLIEPELFSYPWLESVDQLSGTWNLARWSVDARSAGISAGILMEVDVGEDQLQSEAAHFGSLATEPGNLVDGIVAACRPELEGFEKQLDDLAHPKLVGLRRVLHVAPEGTLDSPHLAGNLRMLAKLGLAFDLCARPDQLIDILRLIEDCPDTQFVLDHAGNPPVGLPTYNDWSTSIAALALRPNLVCKISGLVNHVPDGKDPLKSLQPVFDHVVHKFGTHRVVFGGDWPVCTLADFQLGDWTNLALQLTEDWSQSDQDAFLENNARAVYGLD
jgi:predicted TIM-barrel fold metal-dependent hydrolase